MDNRITAVQIFTKKELDYSFKNVELLFSFLAFFLFITAKKPTEAAPKPWKPPSTTKKPDTSVWDSDSDTAAKKPPSTPLFKGPGKGRGRKRKHSDSEEDYRPLKKTGKVPSSRVSNLTKQI